jgi:hypothetical protein
MVFSGTHGSYYWVEGHGEPVHELLHAHPDIALGKRVLLFGWDERLLKQDVQASASSWLVHERRAFSPPLIEVAQLAAIRHEAVVAWAFFSGADTTPDLGQSPPKPPLPPSRRNGSLRDMSYLHDEPAPGLWREDVSGWAVFVAEMQHLFWEAIAALKPESFVQDGRAFVFVTQDRSLHEAAVAWLRACESADEIVATRLLDTRTLAPDRHVLDVSVGPGGEVVALSAEQPIYRIERRKHARGVYHVPVLIPRVRHYRIHRLSSLSWASTDLPETEELFERVRTLSRGRWLLVHSWLCGSAEQNVSILDADGSQQSTFSIKRGYSQVHTTADDHLWVGYNDEGVYKYGSFGQAGAACLDLEGHSLIRFIDIAKQHDLPTIDDCEAINVDGNDVVWLYYYGKYPLVRLVNGRFDRIWHDFPVTWARGFAVSVDQALFAGSYRYPGLLFHVDLETRAVQKRQPVDQQGQPIRFISAIGRGAYLYLRTEHELLVIDPASWVRS